MADRSDPLRLSIVNAEVDGRVVAITVEPPHIVAVETGGASRPTGTEAVLDAAGGAVLPGLHDHHVHLLATAARRRSIVAGPPVVRSPADFDRVVASSHHATPPGEWLRVIDHEDGVAGAVDRARLDRLCPGRPVRVQDRSGARWQLSSAAMRAAGLFAETVGELPAGVERGDDGQPTGALWRLDEWLRNRLPPSALPDLADLGRELTGFGITGVTDATPTRDVSALSGLAAAVRTGRLPVRVTAMTGAARLQVPAPLSTGPVKLVLGDHELPDFDWLADEIAAAHREQRNVAVHCVTYAAASLVIAAWSAAGVRRGDRIEHASQLTDPHVEQLARLDVTVVTQPGFVHHRGDHYLHELPAAEHDDLYRVGSLLAAGVAVAGSSDAPYGPLDPWRAIAAASTRRTCAGELLGAAERVPARQALGLYLGSPGDPAGPRRRVEPGALADLCILPLPLDAALARPESVRPVVTLIGGRIVHDDR